MNYRHKQMLPLCPHKHCYAPCSAMNAQHLWSWHRWYQIVTLFGGTCLFDLRWESIGSPEWPMLSSSSGQALSGFRGSMLCTPGIPIPGACGMGSLDPWELWSHLRYSRHIFLQWQNTRFPWGQCFPMFAEMCTLHISGCFFASRESRNSPVCRDTCPDSRHTSASGKTHLQALLC